MNVCEHCHDKVHRGEFIVNGYQQTTNGIELDITRIVDQDAVDDLTSLIREWKEKENLSLVKIKQRLEEKKQLSFSIYKITKMLKR
jgi:hypothetical protein